MKSLSCRDVGFDCDYIIQADYDDGIFAEGENHPFNAHGMKRQDFIPAFNEKGLSLIPIWLL